MASPMTTTKAASLANDLVQLFEQLIGTGELAPGSRFPTEKAITEEFAVSRTVVREAFARLAARGLLVSRQGSGAYVADGARYQAFQVTAEEISAIDDVVKLLEMRIGLEVEMADMAAARRTESDLTAMRDSLAAMDASTDIGGSVSADSDFHVAIARATHNDYFVRFTEFLGVRLVPSRRLYLQSDDPRAHQAYSRQINRDHRAIYDAIAAGNEANARRAARRHLQKSLDRHRALSAQTRVRFS